MISPIFTVALLLALASQANAFGCETGLCEASGGVCNADPQSSTGYSCAYPSCAPGAVGANCQWISPCTATACPNGHCSLTAGASGGITYTCTANPPGNQCLTNLCEGNGGTCIIDPLSNLGYTCTYPLCPAGLAGPNCEWNWPCTEDACPGGHCSTALGAAGSLTYICSAAAPGVCAKNACWASGGICVVDPLSGSGGYACTYPNCPTGMVGPNCEWLSPCSDTTCKNGGHCSLVQGAGTGVNFLCSCTNGCSGFNCERKPGKGDT